ncbi:hypothetical protein [Hymenobacter jejuensis]|uniref:Peptidase A2 domain-containing protein n=1 Tax=Hymenobacter jejuensis TaxID=2502781 RepID=A0A5B8A606_9BACT|nr:hypothetical protein [Hymenobacter jejuensis]QDA62143.1 hypothetical protein FHG12_19465 [Hymenobacter jejuensis]
MKLLFKVLISLLLLLVAGGVGGYFFFRNQFEPAPNQLVVTGLPASCDFVWLADTKAQPALPHAALLVPVRITGCPRTCYFQFDTGAPSSVLYANPLAALRARYPATQQALLPQADTLHNFDFALGEARVQARRLRVLRYGAQELPADSTAPVIIGTLGADVLDGRALVLDYGRQQFRLLPQVPDSLVRRAAFVPLAYKSRRLLLEAGLQGKTEQLLFDSGSSAFALLTSKTIWQALAKPTATERTDAVNSWGKTLTNHTISTAAALQLGNTAVPLRTVTYVEGMSLWQSTLMRFSGMGGMLGNEVFRDHTVIVDVRGARFGIIPQPDTATPISGGS